MRPHVRTYLIAGLLVLVPLYTTVFVLAHLFKFLDNLLDPLIDFHVPGLGLISGAALIIAVGALTTNIAGHRASRLVDGVMSRIPLARTLYPAVKHLLTALVMEDSTAFRRIVLVEWPRRGAYVLAFVTGEARVRVARDADEVLLTLFVMRTPNPTAGYVCLARQNETIPLNLRVQDALKLVLSGGLVIPPPRRAKTPPDASDGGQATPAPGA